MVLESWGMSKLTSLIQVKYQDQVELRGVNLCRKVLQILANTVKEKGYERQKDSTCCGRQTDLVRAGVWQLKSNVKMSEPGQRGQTSNHCLGQDVTSLRYIVKFECNEITGR